MAVLAVGASELRPGFTAAGPRRICTVFPILLTKTRLVRHVSQLHCTSAIMTVNTRISGHVTAAAASALRLRAPAAHTSTDADTRHRSVSVVPQMTAPHHMSEPAAENRRSASKRLGGATDPPQPLTSHCRLANPCKSAGRTKFCNSLAACPL